MPAQRRAPRGNRNHPVHVTLAETVVIHVLEYLWKAAYCLHPDASQEAETWVTERLRALLAGHDSSQVAAGIRRSATRHHLSAAKRKAADSCARYLINNRKSQRVSKTSHASAGRRITQARNFPNSGKFQVSAVEMPALRASQGLKVGAPGLCRELPTFG
ncbi:hypothetical protein ACFL5O_10655 [Myxococcota bacterium]